MNREAKGIAQYNRDIKDMDGYIYTGNKIRKSAVLFNKRATEAIANLLDFKGKKVLDVGCGDGTYTVEIFTSLGAGSVVGVEPSDAWELGQKSFSAYAPQVVIQEGNATQLSFPNDSFDIAIMRGVLHHLDDPYKGLSEMFRVAEHVFLLEPNGYNVILKLIEKISPYHRAHAEASYTPRTVRKMAENAGGKFIRDSFSSLVPLLCPDRVAILLDRITPFWGEIPVLSTLGCGLYCSVYRKR